jgi:two-component system response regulator
MNGILLVEDSDSDASLVQRAFRLAGIKRELQRICDGADALDYLQRAETGSGNPAPIPSVLLLDLNLPRLGGIEILEWLRGRQAFDKMLRIVLSQIDDIQTIKNAYAAGAHSYLTKPLHQSEVNDLVASFPVYFSFFARTLPILPDCRKPSAGLSTDPPQ